MEKQEQVGQAGGVFLNGKAQVIEMLQHMTKGEKSRLLANIKMRNPSLAAELMERSFSFSHIENLAGPDLFKVIQQVQAQIFGVALKNQSESFQRKVLSEAPRDYAEKAYDIMIKPIANEKEIIQKAQNKIINILIGLSKKGTIDLSA